VAEKDIAINAQGFNEGQYNGMGHRDIRFNQTKRYLYVTAMGWPEDGRLVVKSLAKKNPHFKKSITSVYLLGYGKLPARQTAEGLEVLLPQPGTSAQMAACRGKNKIAPVLRISK
jgi:alpha-L-fucosidase